MESKRRKALYEDFIFNPTKMYKKHLIVADYITSTRDSVFREVKAILKDQIKQQIPKEYRHLVIIQTVRQPLGRTKIEWIYTPMRDVE